MSIVKPEADGICCFCNTKVAEEALKCRTCSSYCHFRCSELPNYHLIRLYVQRSSTYSCRACVGSEAKFVESEAKVKRIIESERNLIVDVTAETQETVGENSHRGADMNQEEGSQQGTDQRSRNSGAVEDSEQRRSDLVTEETSTRTSSMTLQSENSVRAEICKLYLQKKCPKGKSGRVNGVCPFKHPNICFRYLNGGTKRDGCSKGAGCRFYHPKICYQFARKGRCTRTDCAFYHAKERVRKSQEANVGNSYGREERATEAQRENAANQPSYARVAGGTAGMRPDDSRQGGVQRQASLRPIEGPNTPQQNQASDFLCIQTQMQEQIKQLSHMMQILVSRDSYMANPTKQAVCHCPNRS